MRAVPLLIITWIICALSMFNFPKPATGATFSGGLPSGSFPQVNLSGEMQSIHGGNGEISVKATNLIFESWSITVKGSQLTQIGGSELKLPFGSLKLNSPSYRRGLNCNYTIDNGPWTIDKPDQDPVKILDGSFYPLGLLLGYCDFTFNQSPFTLSIYPNVKMIDPGQATATYTTTITWTLTSTGL